MTKAQNEPHSLERWSIIFGPVREASVTPDPRPLTPDPCLHTSLYRQLL